MRTLLVLILSIFILSACFKKDRIIQHEKGFKYIAYSQSDYGLSPRVGDMVFIKMKITAPNGTIIKESDNIQLQVQQPQYEGGTIDDIFMYMNRGDSMAFFINAVNYFTHTLQETAPDYLSSDDMLRFDIVMLDVMNMRKFEELRRQRLSTGELEEKILLDEFLERVSKKRIEIDSMLFWIPEKEGKGKLIIENDIVELNYIAYFVDGKIFSNTYQSYNPFVFSVGDSIVIEGFNKIMPHLKAYSKGRIIIPSYLGYGNKGLKDIVPPFTSLVFDIEIMKVISNNSL